MFSQQDGFVSLRTGSHVRIGHSHRSPYAGRYGVISSVDAGDNKGPYLVRFEDGTQFRYRAEEIESALRCRCGAEQGRIGIKILEVIHRPLLH